MATLARPALATPATPLASGPSPLLRPFYPALDGLRAIAFLMVFCVHYVVLSSSWEIWKWGWVGVDLFFVLSGFLITGILFDTLHSDGFFRNFYIRRALRIFPLFYGVWLLLLLLTPVLHIAWNRGNLLQALYLGNLFRSPHFGFGTIWFAPRLPGGPERMLCLNHFWSLAVEEQFYLVWPALVYLVRSRRSLLRIALLVMIAAPIARLAWAHLFPADVASGFLYSTTFSRCDELFAGAALALWLRGPISCTTVQLKKRAAMVLTAALALFVLGDLAFPQPRVDTHLRWFVNTFGFSLLGIAGACTLLLALAPGRWLETALTWRPLTFLGRISYGMYVFHAIVIPQVGRLSLDLRPHHLQLLAPALAFCGTVAAAWLSFRFFETPFLRLKSRLAPRTLGPAEPVSLPAA